MIAKYTNMIKFELTKPQTTKTTTNEVSFLCTVCIHRKMNGLGSIIFSKIRHFHKGRFYVSLHIWNLEEIKDMNENRGNYVWFIKGETGGNIWE